MTNSLQCNSKALLVALMAAMPLTGCMMSAAEHGASLQSANDRAMTVGVVQREIRTGMTQGDVATALGSPNIVSKDADGNDTWIYDKIATEASYSNDSGTGAGLLGAGGTPGSSLILGGLFGSYNRNAGASGTTQRTLTVVIRFDRGQRVNGFTYHTSKF